VKKFLALALILTLVLGTVLAFAGPTPSPTPPKTHVYKDELGRPVTECYDEIPAISAELDSIWLAVQMSEGVEKIRPASERPKVCFMAGPLAVRTEDGKPGLLFGYWNDRSNEILIAVMGDQTECILVHEYLHAIFGPGHDKFKERMNAAGCFQDR
jgi:hypothetical protein